MNEESKKELEIMEKCENSLIAILNDDKVNGKPCVP